MYESMRAVGFVASKTTYRSLLIACANHGDLERFDSTAKAMLNDGFDLNTFDELHLKAIARAIQLHEGGTTRVNQLLDQAKQKWAGILQRTPKPGLVLLTSMLLVLASAKRLNTARDFFKEISEKWGVRGSLRPPELRPS